MRLGLNIFLTDRSIRPVELARAAEERGFASLWIPEHTHIPVERRSPYPAGGDLPEEYRRTLDPFVALTAAASVTERLRVGTAILLLAQHDPIVTAKAAASLDLVSGGRFSLGVGYGWNMEELEDHGGTRTTRREVVRERLLAMTSLWADEEASFSGSHMNLSRSWAWPKPVQSPRPPVLIGGAAGPTLFAHIAEVADGWIPIGGGGLGRTLPDLQRVWEEAGRPGRPTVLPVGVAPDAGKLEHYGELGVTEAALALPSAGRDEVLPLLDRYAAFL